MTNFSIDCDWHDVAPVEAPEDATYSELSMSCDGDVLTSNRARRGSRSEIHASVFGPVASLADWFVSNWSAILWEATTPFPTLGGDPKKPTVPGAQAAVKLMDDDGDDEALAGYADWLGRHIMGLASGELPLPSLTIVPEIEHIVLAVDSPARDFDGGLIFLGMDGKRRQAMHYVVDKDQFREACRSFIDQTLARIGRHVEFSQWSQWMDNRWRKAQALEVDPQRRLVLLVGRPAAQAIMALKSDDESVAAGLTDLLIDCPRISKASQLTAIKNVVAADLSLPPRKRAPLWHQLRIRDKESNTADHVQGYEAARRVRDYLNLGTEPIDDWSELLKKLDIRLDAALETSLFRSAVCAAARGEGHILASSTFKAQYGLAAHRFAIANALGRLLTSPRDDGRPICAANSDYARLSQSRKANAFAAEFLLPSAALESHKGRTMRQNDLAKLTQAYGISSSAAGWHAHNQGISLPPGARLTANVAY